MIINSVYGDEFIKPLEGVKIVLDAGMGGEADPGGAISESDRDEVVPVEIKINKKVILLLRIFLEEAGASVSITPENKNPEGRAKWAIEQKPHFILSIQHNYSKNPGIDFTTVYYGSANRDITLSLASEISRELSLFIDNQNMGAQFTEFAFLKNNPVPTAFICCSFLTKKDRMKKVNSLEGCREEAIGVVNGVIKFWKEKKDAVLGQVKTELPPLPTPPLPPFLESGIKYPQPPVTTYTAPPPPPPPPLPVSEPAPAKQTEPQKFLPFKPPFLNPVNGIFDQSWLFGESYGTLSTKRGLSFDVPMGTVVMAVSDGEVIAIDSSGNTSDISAYPNYVFIKHTEPLNGKPVFSLYGNLNEINVKPGDKVIRGQPIGKTGQPYSVSNKRDTQFEFELRIGGDKTENARNPELYLTHISSSVGIIVGKVKDKNGVYAPKLKISGAVKPSNFKNYQYSLTYSPEIPITDDYMENLIISDVVEGTYTLTSDYGSLEVKVQSGMITFIDWTVNM